MKSQFRRHLDLLLVSTSVPGSPPATMTCDEVQSESQGMVCCCRASLRGHSGDLLAVVVGSRLLRLLDVRLQRRSWRRWTLSANKDFSLVANCMVSLPRAASDDAVQCRHLWRRLYTENEHVVLFGRVLIGLPCSRPWPCPFLQFFVRAEDGTAIKGATGEFHIHIVQTF